MKKLIFILTAGIILLSVLIFAGIKAYRIFYQHNINAEEQGYVLFIKTGSNYDDVINTLTRDTVLKDLAGFEWLAEKLKYPQSVRPGRYILTKEMSNRDIIYKLRAGDQNPVNIFIKKFRTKTDLAGFFSKKLEVDSSELVTILNDTVFLSKYLLLPETSISFFLSDSYEFFWNTSALQLFERMMREYEKYWTNSRLAKAKDHQLTPVEAITLASIVEEETNNTEEKPRIAGVYINRLQKGIRLQADPTVKFAMQNFTLRRILTRHLRYESPYNTYVNAGLPPGPICIPSKQSLEAVLNAESHDYIFFCAKPDGSGTHHFAQTYREHQSNARKYRKQLDRDKIF